MDEKSLKQLQRHDLVSICQAGKDRIKAQIQGNYSGEELRLIEQVFDAQFYNYSLPGIVRRDEIPTKEIIPVGFVPPELYMGRRLRIAAFTRFDEIMDVVTPYNLLQMNFIPRNLCMKAIAAAAEVAERRQIQVGVLGSAGLEIYTQYFYTNENSDIDLLVRHADYLEIQQLYQELQRISRQYQAKLDLEVSLTNGYGIKAAELFMNTTALLGKSLADVRLLSRQEVLKALK